MTGREHDAPGTPDRRGPGDAAETPPGTSSIPRWLALTAATLASIHVGRLIGDRLEWPTWLVWLGCVALAGSVAFCLDRWGPAWMRNPAR